MSVWKITARVKLFLFFEISRRALGLTHLLLGGYWSLFGLGKERGVYTVLLGKPEGKRPLWRPRRKWVDNIRMDLQEVGCGYMDWIGLTQDRDGWRTLVSAVMNIRVP